MVRAAQSRVWTALRTVIAGLAMLAVWAAPVWAQTSEQLALDDAYQHAWAAIANGPAAIPLLDQGTLKIGPHHGFVPRAEAERLMHAMGNSTGPSFQGLVLPQGSRRWFITVDFGKIGHTPPAVLAALKDKDIYTKVQKSAGKGNEGRLKLEAGKLDIGGAFVEKPYYDRKRDRMVMATRVAETGPTDDSGDSAKLDAYIFGREGVITLTLATSMADYAELRQNMDVVYFGSMFFAGKRSADVQPGDRQTEYPLDMIFGSLTLEEAKAGAEKAAAMAAAKDARKRAAAEAAAAMAESVEYWLKVAFGGLFAVGGMMLARRGEQSGDNPRLSRRSRGPAVSEATITRVLRSQTPD